ncbi:hypothetical protein [Acetobacter cerevisiae]|uniref:hypothetical protein n=1 Tax=Acetobacter cerevisiae TaxID=178900 RepID=UPI002156D4BC|nr:hypothetical protein [Acetobacter cerevisiae]GBQ08782.1 hypothetical protein AA14362_2033 [Acetobacter cerevisiae DSM 14362]
MNTMKPFDVFYKDIGFDLYPFSSWSSEQEKKYRKDIFIKPNYYGPIEEKFRDGLEPFWKFTDERFGVA